MQSSHDKKEIQNWLIAKISEYLSLEPSIIDIKESFTSYGLASRDAIILSGDLESWLNCRFSPTLLYEYPNIESLSQYLTQGLDISKDSGISKSLVKAGENLTNIESTTSKESEVGYIAIIGIGCRFPGADGPDAFWRLLRDGVDAITEVPPDRWDANFYYHSDQALPGKMNTRWGGFLEQVDRFDAHFFGISPREAVRMDPQQRILLELSQDALDDAGQVIENLAGTSTGVFIGISSNDYGQRQLSDPNLSDSYVGTGNSLSIAANRISYIFDFQGPSIAVDTACSSSLTAVYLACRSLQEGESTLALAGGVNIMLSPAITINFTKAGFMAPDGRCKAFDSRANGYVRGEGAGIVVLKNLDRALADEDPIYAVIRGSAINQDGHSNGLTAPNPRSQEKVLREAYRRAHISPGGIQYIEAHGTGTALGDPIELKALGTVLSQNRPRGNCCAIGSVKTNIGHLEAAAGIAGLIKTALALKHRLIPASLHFRQPNPHIPFAELPLQVQQHTGPWPHTDDPLLAGVSAFGFGGTNVHVVMQEAPKPEDPTNRKQKHRQIHLLPLSARSPEALRTLAGAYREFLKNNSDESDRSDLSDKTELPDLSDICFTASVRRSHYSYRLSLVAHSHGEMVEQLRSFRQDGGLIPVPAQPSGQPKLVFIFSGQGCQWAGMGRELLEQEPVFRDILEKCDKLFEQYTGWSLLKELKNNASHSHLDDTEISQPAIFAMQVALANLWRSWGIEPGAVIGHSIGEVSAAYAAGVLTLEEAVRVVYQRSRLMGQTAGKGKMALVSMSGAEAQRKLVSYEGRVVVAAHNSPTATVLSGEPEALIEIIKMFQEQGIFCRLLRLNYAFHGPLMEPLTAELSQALSDLKPGVAHIPFYSTVTGNICAGPELTPAYWCRNMAEPVHFAEAVVTAVKDGCRIFLDSGPHPVLGSEISQCLEYSGQEGTVLASLRRNKEERAMMLETLGIFYSLGCSVCWEKLYPPGKHCVSLPSYPWQRKRLWIDSIEPISTASMIHPLVQRRVSSPLKEIIFESRFSGDTSTFLSDHRFGDMTIFPAAAYLEMALAGMTHIFGTGPYTMEEVVIQKALILSKHLYQTVQLVLIPRNNEDNKNSAAALCKIFSLAADSDQWHLHATGKIHAGLNVAINLPLPIKELQVQCPVELPVVEFYQKLSKHGLKYGSNFRGIEELWSGCEDGQALGRIRLPEELAAGTPVNEAYQLHPVLIDSCFQLFAAALLNEDSKFAGTYLPVEIKGLEFSGISDTNASGHFWAHARIRPNQATLGDKLMGDAYLLDDLGQVLAAITGIVLKKIDPGALFSMTKTAPITQETLKDWLYRIDWKPQVITEKAPATETGSIEQESWVIFSDRGGLGVLLSQLLQEHGQNCIMVFPAAAYEKLADGQYLIDPAQPGNFRQLFSDIDGNNTGTFRRNRYIAHLWGLDAEISEKDSLGSLQTTQTLVLAGILHLVAAVASKKASPGKLQLFLVTRGAQPVVPGNSFLSVAQAPLWGLGNVLALEHPEFHCVMVDLDPTERPGDAQILLNEMIRAGREQDGENKIAFRSGIRFVSRLTRQVLQPAQVPAEKDLLQVSQFTGGQSFRLNITARGMLDNLELCPLTRRPPGPDEIEIQVRAAGLNFRDVLNVLGLYPGDAGPLGGECAGKITAIGEKVTGFRIGDDVIAIASGCFASYVNTPAVLAALKPPGLSFEEAATIPITFLTAYYGLVHLGKITAGDHVLIHAAAGGVGLAAVQLAKRAGAEIYGTAGNPDKRRFLESLGVLHVMNSRSLDFADQIQTLTKGKGIDIVLNSLAGEYIPKSLALLKNGGRFIELGKTGVWDKAKVAQFRDGISYFLIDLAELVRRQPQFTGDLLRMLLEEFNIGSLKPLPYRNFTISEAVSAFRCMAKAKHTGKIILSLPDGKTKKNQKVTMKNPIFRSDAAYLITGGFGGLGLLVAQRMAAQGARHIVLMGRRGVSEPGKKIISAIKKAGAEIMEMRADVTRYEQVTGMLEQINKTMPPLRGVIHAAGVLDDDVLIRQKWERFARVMAPKVTGAWLLHTLTLAFELDFFVLFSSAASLLGSPGQGSYAAANAFLDALAHYRHLQGLPALSIAWGPWAQTGMTASITDHHITRWQETGVRLITPEQGLDAFEQILEKQFAGACSQLMVLPIQWSNFGQQFNPPESLPLFFSELYFNPNRDLLRGNAKTKNMVKPQPELLKRLAAAPPNRLNEIAATYVREQVVKIMQLDSTQPLSTQQGLFELGMDSLMAVELKNRLEKGLGRPLPMAVTFDYPTIDALADFIVKDYLNKEELTPEIITKPTGQKQEGLGNINVGPIAIIGIGCRFPGGVNDTASFWKLLRDGVDAISEVPANRWNVDDFYDPNPDAPGKTYSRWGGFLDQVDQFDAQFFGISPREAVKMDPQQRLLLEIAWEALEDAGQVPDHLVETRTGVFIGLSNNDYLRLQMNPSELAHIDAYTGTGSATSVSAGRLSYILGLQGPNMVVDTACSSSLAAVHLGCQSLHTGESDLVLAGGVNLALVPDSSVYFSKLRALSADGRCKTFDAAANGYVQGEGCGIVVLKRLDNAQAAGDNILAVIRGSAVNHDGRSSGLTVPNGLAQQAVIRAALANAAVEPAHIGYVEAHGTGTPLGDPIEVEALAAVLGAGRSPEQRLVIGSVKTNIGHLEAAAGIAGLIKTVLTLQHGEIPPHLHLKEPNPRLDWGKLPVTIPTHLMPWATTSTAAAQPKERLAGVSAFGFSGTNVHIILAEAPQTGAYQPRAAETSNRPYLLPLSTRAPEALHDLAAAYLGILKDSDLSDKSDRSDLSDLSDLIFTASVRRNHHDHRLALVGCSAAELSQGLQAFLKEETRAPGLAVGHAVLSRRPKLAFVFSGQGSQWTGMGLELIREEPVFRDIIVQCDVEIKEHTGWSLLAELAADESHSKLQQVDVLQPVLFSIQAALAALWRSWGIDPDAVVGYSLGEVAAAYAGGALSLKNAVRVICMRSRLLKQISGQGNIAIVETSLEKARLAAAGSAGQVTIAASSSPTITVLSGEPAALEKVLTVLQEQGVFCLSRQENVAVHSEQLEPLQDELLRMLQGLAYQPPVTSFYSTVTAKEAGTLECNAEYWARNLRETVLFSETIQQMIMNECEIFLEISPHPHHLSSIQEILHFSHKKGRVLPSLRKKENARTVLLNSLGILYSLGFPVNWERLYTPGGRVTHLPAYPWQRERYWLEVKTTPAEKGVDWLYELQWQPVDGSVIKPKPIPSSVHGAGSHLIFSDSGGVGEVLNRIFTEQGETCFLVFPGEKYLRQAQDDDTDHFIINPGRPEDFQQLFQDILASEAGSQIFFRGIIYLWGLSAPGLDDAPGATTALARSQVLGCNGVLHLVQQLAQAGLNQFPRLWLVTRGAQPTAENENNIPNPLAVSQAPIWGFGRALAIELPELWGGLLDLDPGASEVENARGLVEIIKDAANEDQWALRHGKRYVARWKRQRNPARLDKNLLLRFRDEATYLITGGLGDLGLKVAHWLVEKGVRRLILLGRIRPPFLSPQRMAAVAELEKLGAVVHIASVDVADETLMRSFLKDFAKKEWPPIKGVIHTAGVIQGGTILTLDSAAIENVFRPKAVGAWVLHRLFENVELDFFILFSAISGQFGWLGQGAANYAAANAFLDALAVHRRARQQKALSIAWGPWAQIGMAARKTENLERLKHLGIGGISPEQGIAMLEHLVQLDAAQGAAVLIDWRQFFQTSPGATACPFLTSLGKEVDEGPVYKPQELVEFRGRLLNAEPAERYRLLEAHIKAQLAGVLRLPADKVDVHKPVIEMGLDSLMALEMKNQIQAGLGISIPLLAFLRNPDVTGIINMALELLAASAPASALKQNSQGKKKPSPLNIEHLSDQEVDKLLRELYKSDV